MTGIFSLPKGTVTANEGATLPLKFLAPFTALLRFVLPAVTADDDGCALSQLAVLEHYALPFHLS